MIQAPGGRTDLVKVTYPDPLFRPIPIFTVEVPPEWVISEFPDALYVMGPAADAPGYWTNVIVRHERMARGTTLEAVAKVTWDNLKADFPDATIKDQRVVLFESLHHVREVELTIPDEDGPVTRVDSFVFGPVVDQPTVDLFQFTFLNPSAAGDEAQALHAKILESLHFSE
ncbi:hypothetical protein HQ535_08415 [bacterium]|nr:hypothetical protein [bacterium]